MQQEKIAKQQANALTISYLQKLSNKELTELFVSISSQFASRLTDCKETEGLENLQAYIHLIMDEIKFRDLPPE